MSYDIVMSLKNDCSRTLWHAEICISLCQTFYSSACHCTQCFLSLKTVLPVSASSPSFSTPAANFVIFWPDYAAKYFTFIFAVFFISSMVQITPSTHCWVVPDVQFLTFLVCRWQQQAADHHPHWPQQANGRMEVCIVLYLSVCASGYLLKSWCLETEDQGIYLATQSPCLKKNSNKKQQTTKASNLFFSQSRVRPSKIPTKEEVTHKGRQESPRGLLPVLLVVTVLHTAAFIGLSVYTNNRIQILETTNEHVFVSPEFYTSLYFIYPMSQLPSNTESFIWVLLIS